MSHYEGARCLAHSLRLRVIWDWDYSPGLTSHFRLMDNRLLFSPAVFAWPLLSLKWMSMRAVLCWSHGVSLTDVVPSVGAACDCVCNARFALGFFSPPAGACWWLDWLPVCITTVVAGAGPLEISPRCPRQICQWRAQSGEHSHPHNMTLLVLQYSTSSDYWLTTLSWPILQTNN